MTAVSYSLTLLGNVEFDVNRILALPTWADKNHVEQKWSNSKNVCVNNFPILLYIYNLHLNLHCYMH